MRVYTKGIAQTRRERARRRQVLQLTEKGYTQQQIALELGVSAKTVQRDLWKLRRYISKLAFDAKMKTDKLISDRLEQYPMMVRFELLTDLMCAKGDRRLERSLMREALSGQYKPKRRRNY